MREQTKIVTPVRTLPNKRLNEQYNGSPRIFLVQPAS